MREGNEGYPIWSKPTEGLLWHKSQKMLMVVTGGMCHNPHTVHRTLLRSRRPVRVPMMTHPLSKAPTTGTRASELDLGAVEEGRLVR